MSNKALNWVEKISLPRGEKTLLLVLANKFNEKDGYCHPKTKTLAYWCSCSERSIKRYIKSLVSKNIIQTEEFRNQLGHRICLKYYLNFDLDLNTLSDNMSPRVCNPLVTRCPSLSDTVSKPKCQIDTKALIYNKPNNKPKENIDFSLVDKNEQTEQANEPQGLKILLGVKFTQLKKINRDTADLYTAEKLFFKLCLENKHPINFAENLIKARRQQIIDFEKLTAAGHFVPAPCNLKKWLEGRRWNDIIKPIGIKKKVSPYIRCGSCGEEYLKGSYCKICAERAKPRMAYA